MSRSSFGGFAVLVSLVLVTGCATLGPTFKKLEQIPEGKALVYIYRPKSFHGSVVIYDVKAGEKAITTLYNGGYYRYVADPGELELWASTETTSAVTLDVRPGQVYYVRGTLSQGIMLGRPHLVLVSEDQALGEITACKLIPDSAAAK